MRLIHSTFLTLAFGLGISTPIVASATPQGHVDSNAPAEAPVWEPIVAPREGYPKMLYSPSTARTEKQAGTNARIRVIDVKFEDPSGISLYQTWKVKASDCLGERVDWEVHTEGQPMRIQPNVSLRDNAMAMAVCGRLVHPKL